MSGGGELRNKVPQCVVGLEVLLARGPCGVLSAMRHIKQLSRGCGAVDEHVQP